MFLSASPDTIVKARIEVIEKLGAETQIYCELDHESKESSVIDNSTQMIAKISSRAVVSLKDVIDLAFDAHHIHLFDGYTEATMLERDEGYEVIPENAEGSAFRTSHTSGNAFPDRRCPHRDERDEGADEEGRKNGKESRKEGREEGSRGSGREERRRKRRYPKQLSSFPPIRYR